MRDDEFAWLSRLAPAVIISPHARCGRQRVFDRCAGCSFEGMSWPIRGDVVSLHRNVSGHGPTRDATAGRNPKMRIRVAIAAPLPLKKLQ